MSDRVQGCMYCGKLLSIPENADGDCLVYCSVCGVDGKKRKREYRERF